MRRFGVACLAGWYLLASAGLLPAALDGLRPRTKIVASSDFPCARHACGCKTAQQCRHHCCCVMKTAPKQTCALPHRVESRESADSASRVQVSWRSEAQCRGQAPADGVFASSRLAPHLPPVGLAILRDPQALSVFIPSDATALPSFTDPPDKVPLPAFRLTA